MGEPLFHCPKCDGEQQAPFQPPCPYCRFDLRHLDGRDLSKPQVEKWHKHHALVSGHGLVVVDGRYNASFDHNGNAQISDLIRFTLSFGDREHLPSTRGNISIRATSLTSLKLSDQGRQSSIEVSWPAPASASSHRRVRCSVMPTPSSMTTFEPSSQPIDPVAASVKSQLSLPSRSAPNTIDRGMATGTTSSRVPAISGSRRPCCKSQFRSEGRRLARRGLQRIRS